MMEFKTGLTEFLNNFIKDAELQEVGIGCSDSQIVKITKNSNIYYLKTSTNINVKTEYIKLKWLQNRLPVPRIVSYEEKNGVNYLLTETLNGEMVCSNYYINNYDKGLDVILEGLKVLRSTDISDCDFNVGLEHKLNVIKHNIDNNRDKVSNVVSAEALAKYRSIGGIYDYLISNKPKEELVFTHGDLSLPNVFGKDDKLSGFIDVADCGVADFWWDVAIVAKSMKRNYGEAAVQNFYQKLNCDIRYENIEYYKIMLNLDV